MPLKTRPVVLCISGHDPIGGAGVQADIEAVAANGCHACSAITCLTVQDSCDVHSVYAQPVGQVASQIRAVLDDNPVAAVKIGLLGSADMALAITELLSEMAPLPVVLDPVLTSGSGLPLSDSGLRQAICGPLLPFVTLLTPNSREARRLAPGEEDLENCARQLIEQGCKHVLITGTHEPGPRVVNRLYASQGSLDESTWERLPGSFHGSGCTLASAIAARLALAGPEALAADRSEALRTAVREAQIYTWRTLVHGLRLGRCQYLPDRLFHFRDGNP